VPEKKKKHVTMSDKKTRERSSSRVCNRTLNKYKGRRASRAKKEVRGQKGLEFCAGALWKVDKVGSVARIQGDSGDRKAKNDHGGNFGKNTVKEGNGQKQTAAYSQRENGGGMGVGDRGAGLCQKNPKNSGNHFPREWGMEKMT